MARGGGGGAGASCLGASVLVVLFLLIAGSTVNGLGVNWGTISINPLPPGYVVKMLQANGINKVKLFDADYNVVRSMAGTNIEVMVAAPNNLLSTLASDLSAAQAWVKENVTQFIFSGGVNIKYVNQFHSTSSLMKNVHGAICLRPIAGCSRCLGHGGSASKFPFVSESNGIIMFGEMLQLLLLKAVKDLRLKMTMNRRKPFSGMWICRLSVPITMCRHSFRM